jgi:hypothetical protein
MATFRRERTGCQCVDEEVNRRIFWLDSSVPGRVYVYLSPEDASRGGEPRAETRADVHRVPATNPCTYPPLAAALTAASL